MIFAILMGVLLASCEQRPARGYVVGKEYKAAHNVVYRDEATKNIAHTPRSRPMVCVGCGFNQCAVVQRR